MTRKKKASPKAAAKVPKPKGKPVKAKAKAPVEESPSVTTPEPAPEPEPIVVATEPMPVEVPKADEAPVLVPLTKDPEAFVPAVALVTFRRRIGPNVYLLEEGQDVVGGVLHAHMSMLEDAGQAKRK